MVEPHTHNDSDAPGIPYENLVILPESEVSLVTGTADATYSSNEQTMLNDLKTAVNAINAALQAKRILQ